jgi:hypothetical protein
MKLQQVCVLCMETQTPQWLRAAASTTWLRDDVAAALWSDD